MKEKVQPQEGGEKHMADCMAEAEAEGANALSKI